MTALRHVRAGREHMRVAYAACNALSICTDGRTELTKRLLTYRENLTLVNVRGRRKGEYNVSNGYNLSGVWRRLYRGVHQPVNRRGIPPLRATLGAHSEGAEEMTTTLRLTESAFQQRIIDLAHIRGWLVHHDRPVRLPSGRYGTPIQGDAGFPDLVLARRGVVLTPEVKTDAGRLAPDQHTWRDAIGDQWRLWRPADWPEIQEALR